MRSEIKKLMIFILICILVGVGLHLLHMNSVGIVYILCALFQPINARILKISFDAVSISIWGFCIVLIFLVSFYFGRDMLISILLSIEGIGIFAFELLYQRYRTKNNTNQ